VITAKLGHCTEGFTDTWFKWAEILLDKCAVSELCGTGIEDKNK